jgi:hypothetical protein
MPHARGDGLSGWRSQWLCYGFRAQFCAQVAVGILGPSRLFFFGLIAQSQGAPLGGLGPGLFGKSQGQRAWGEIPHPLAPGFALQVGPLLPPPAPPGPRQQHQEGAPPRRGCALCRQLGLAHSPPHAPGPTARVCSQVDSAVGSRECACEGLDTSPRNPPRDGAGVGSAIRSWVPPEFRKRVLRAMAGGVRWRANFCRNSKH